MPTRKPRVLIISYYWPPSGGAGVQRWLKFVKYLCEFGYEPVVYTPENPEYPSIDKGLLSEIPASLEVIRVPITEPYDHYRRLVGMKKTERIQTGFLSEGKKPTRRENLARWVRGNLFIPDARFLWIKPSVRFLSNYLSQRPVDLLVSTGPPHSMHLIARALKKRLDLPWVADFRDPWTNIDFYDELKLTPWADRKHHRLEQAVLKEADTIVVVGKTMKIEFANWVSEAKITVLPNGYDADDLSVERVSVDRMFSIAHIGSFSPARNPVTLWKVIAELVSKGIIGADLRIRTIGKVDAAVNDQIQQNQLGPFVEHIPYLPHAEVIAQQARSAVLLLVVNRTKNAKGILTGKVFEYLAAQRPILAIGPTDGDLAHLLRETGGAMMVDYDDVEGLRSALIALYQNHRNGIGLPRASIEPYDRRKLTKLLIHEVFDPLIQQKDG